MNFAGIPPGTRLFIDPNPFIYAFGPDPVFGPPSVQLLERIENQEIDGITSAHVLAEVSHRLMALEACAVLGWPYTGIAQRLRRHPAEVRSLSRYRQAIDEILAIGVRVLPVLPQHVIAAADISRQYGLLTNDGLLVAIMHDQGLTELASSDGDFDQVSGLVRHVPV